MKVAIYARVSTTDQDCAMQLTETRDFIARRGWEAAGEFVDTGVSGTKSSRHELDRLMDAARRGQFAAICLARTFSASPGGGRTGGRPSTEPL
jgi:DNA invertase Pin-like site-specific DNA recombinase